MFSARTAARLLFVPADQIDRIAAWVSSMLLSIRPAALTKCTVVIETVIRYSDDDEFITGANVFEMATHAVEMVDGSFTAVEKL